MKPTTSATGSYTLSLKKWASGAERGSFLALINRDGNARGSSSSNSLTRWHEAWVEFYWVTWGFSRTLETLSATNLAIFLFRKSTKYEKCHFRPFSGRFKKKLLNKRGRARFSESMHIKAQLNWTRFLQGLLSFQSRQLKIFYIGTHLER